MRKFLAILTLGLALAGCAKQVEEITIKGVDGRDGVSMGISMSPTAPSCGLPGGVTIKTFVDLNFDTNLDLDEPVKQTSIVCNGKDGLDGQDGISPTLTIAQASAAQCPTGGYLLTSSQNSSPVAICNGAKGDTGPQGLAGLAGPQGIPGLSAYQIWLNAGNVGTEQDFLIALRGEDGADGQNGQNGQNGSNGLSAYQLWLNLGNTGTEAQFIASLKGPTGATGASGQNGLSAYQIWLNLGNTGTEAQFVASLKGPAGAVGPVGPQGPAGTSGGVGNVTPVQLCPGDTGAYKEYGLVVGTNLFAVYHDNAAGNTFLALLAPGSYRTTNGSNCVFTYANNGTTATLSNSSGTTTVNLTSGNSGGGNNTLAGSCSIVKFADYQSEQQFHFAVTGMASYASYTLEVTFNNGGNVNQVQDSNGGASTYVNPLYTIAPQNLANGFDFYAKHNGNVVNKPTVASAKVKKNGQEMTCTVQN